MIEEEAKIDPKVENKVTEVNNPAFYNDSLFGEPTEAGYNIVSPIEPPKGAPSFGNTLGAAFRKYNIFYSLYQEKFDKRDYNQDMELGYDPIKENVLFGVPQEYWDRVLMQTSKKDALLTVKQINQELSDAETLSKSGMISSTLAVIGAGAIDPTVLIPFMASAKYASMSKGILAGAVNAGKIAFPVAAIRNTAIYAQKETEGFNAWAHDTIMETVFAAGIGGILGGFASKNIKGQMANAEAFFKATENDIKITHTFNPNGEFKKSIAVAREGSSAGAAEVDATQKMLDMGNVYFKDNSWVQKVFGWGSPIIRGVTSKFKTVRVLTNSLFPHPFEMAGGVAERIPEHSAMNFLKEIRGRVSDVKLNTHQMWIRSLGIKGPLKETRAAIGEMAGKYKSLKKFSDEVGIAFRAGHESADPFVVKASQFYEKHLKKPLEADIKEYFPSFKEHEFSNIVNFLSRIYDKKKITADPMGFIEFVQDELYKQNAKLKELHAPMENIHKSIKSSTTDINRLKRSLEKATGNEFEKIKTQLNSELKARSVNKEFLERFDTQIAEKIKNGEIDLDLLNGRPQLTPKERVEFDKITSSLNDAEKELKELKKLKAEPTPKTAKEQAKIELERMKDKKITDALQTKKDVSTEVILKTEKEYKSKLKREKELNKKIKTAREKVKIEKEKIQDALDAGTINKRLYRTTRSGNRLIKLSDPPTLRKVLSKKNVENLSYSIRDNILQQSEEQISGQMWKGLIAGGSNPFDARVFLANDVHVQPWLVNDINIISGVSSENLARHLYMEKTMQKYGVDTAHGQLNVTKSIKTEYHKMQKEILKQPDSPKRVKELHKLEKSFKENKDFIRDAYKIFMGQYTDRSAIESRVADSIKKFSVATLLGNVPILMLTEFAAPLFRYTFKTYVQDGAIGALQRLGLWKKNVLKQYGKDHGEWIRGMFADANLCNNRYLGNRIQAIYGAGTQYHPKNIIERTIDNLAAISQNLSLANHVMDVQEFMVASMADSSFIRSMQKHWNGKKLLRAEVDQLDRARLNPEVWGYKIMNEFNKHGKKVGDSYVSNFHLWDDPEVARVYSMSINQDVRNVILLPEAMDKPLWMQNPYGGVMGQFMSYMFDATNKFTVPLLTKPDTTKLIGAISMMGISSLVGPLRQLSRGEEPDMDPKTLLSEALENSGIFGMNYEALMKANQFMDLPPLRFLTPDRFKKRAFRGVGGPSAGLLGSVYQIVGALANGEMSQQEYRKALRLFLGTGYNWYTARLFDKAARSFSQYENRSQAKRAKGG